MVPALSQLETPLFDVLLKHRNRHPIQFHIPGHKKGQGMDPAFREFVGDNVLSIDLINIAPLDDLHSPKGAIKKHKHLLLRPLVLIVHSFPFKVLVAPS